MAKVMTTLTGTTQMNLETHRRNRGVKSTATPSPQPAPSIDLESAASRPGCDPCDVACDAMPGFLLGDLNPRDAGWLLDHTEDCSYCHGVLGRYERIDDMLDRLNRFVTADAPPPPPFLMPVVRQAGYSRIE